MIPHWARNILANLLVPRNILVSRLEVLTVDVAVPDLPPGLVGFTIAQVSDLHIGSATHWVPRWAPEAADVLARSGVDVVVNTGDFFWHEPPPSKAAAYASHFVQLQPGVDSHAVNLAILGNHDYYASAASRHALVKELRSSGIGVLINSAVCVSHGSASVSIVGLTDEEDTFEAGVRTLQECARPRIALVHVPDLAEKLPFGSADLVLSGHTHGGQVTLPYLESAIVERGCGSKYVEGMYVINGMKVYVNRGLGYTGFPIRFRARPELTLVRLVR